MSKTDQDLLSIANSDNKLPVLSGKREKINTTTSFAEKENLKKGKQHSALLFRDDLSFREDEPQNPNVVLEDEEKGELDEEEKASLQNLAVQSPNDSDIALIIQHIDNPAHVQVAFESYIPRNKEIDMLELRAFRNTRVKCYRDSVYYGQIVNGNRHGKGIMIYKNKRIYEGDWENEAKHGKGMEIFSNGNIYKGDFLNGKPDGVGKYIWKNGQEYQGEWRYGLKHGSGMWKGSQGESYIGEWKNDKPDGDGVYIYQDGNRYEGEFLSGQKHGHGTEKFANGDVFVGYYENGKPNGLGEYRWSNGSSYRGFFKNGLRHGKGVWRKNSGNSDTYEGEWANDKKCGVGVYNWTSGNFYKGSYYDDLRHGYGEMYWNDGSYYLGHWRKGVQEGIGELYLPDEPPQKGVFREGVYIGPLENHFGNEKEEETKLPPIKQRNVVPIKRADLSFLPATTKAKENQTRANSLLRGGRHRTTENIEHPEIRRRTLSADNENFALPGLEDLSNEKDSRKFKSNQVTSRKHKELIDFHDVLAKKKLAEKILHDIEEFSFRDARVQKKDQSTQAGFFPARGPGRRVMVKTEFVFQEPAEKPTPRKRTFTISPPRVTSVAQVKPLDAKELIRWNAKKETIALSERKRLDDVNNPETVAKIREIINPPTWKWWKMYSIQPGKSDLKVPPLNFGNMFHFHPER